MFCLLCFLFVYCFTVNTSVLKGTRYPAPARQPTRLNTVRSLEKYEFKFWKDFLRFKLTSLFAVEHFSFHLFRLHIQISWLSFKNVHFIGLMSKRCIDVWQQREMYIIILFKPLRFSLNRSGAFFSFIFRCEFDWMGLIIYFSLEMFVNLNIGFPETEQLFFQSWENKCWPDSHLW